METQLLERIASQAPDMVVITGCTASGKSALGLELAEAIDGEILSCDSLSVYRYMDIGTAKPTLHDQARIPHYGIDLVDPCEQFDVSQYLQEAQAAVKKIQDRGKKVVVVGGSGFYLKSFYAPVVDSILVPDAIEKKVEQLEKEKGLAGLMEKLLEYNNENDLKIDVKNPRKVAAALKKCLVAGKTLNEINNDFSKLKSPFQDLKKWTLLVDKPRDVLKIRARQRVNDMVAKGLIDEVRFLIENYDLNRSASAAIGYKEVIYWLRCPTSIDDLIDQITQNTCQLIRKQTTWFKKQVPIDMTVD